MNTPESPPWGYLQWALSGLASIGAGAVAFVWRPMTRLTLSRLPSGNTSAISTCRSRPMNSALLRLAERLEHFSV